MIFVLASYTMDHTHAYAILVVQLAQECSDCDPSEEHDGSEDPECIISSARIHNL
jgi:hypothetical protein